MVEMTKKQAHTFAAINECLQYLEDAGWSEDKSKAPVLTGTDYGLTDHGYTIPEGYEFVGVRKDFCDREEIVLRKKTSIYPKTYAECKEMLDENVYYGFSVFMTLQNLIICRDAYWKIAGEEMGLDKPWKHNYLKDANTIRYAIYNTGDEIVKLDGKLYRNYILCFPTEEMRDAFYENFKDLIEECKELI